MPYIDELIGRLRCMPCQSASHSKLILDAIDILADYDNLVVANEMLENMLEVARSKSQVQHGEWLECTRETIIPVEYDSNGDLILHKVVEYRCSLCGRLEGKKEPYCNCGAKMDGGTDNDQM